MILCQHLPKALILAVPQTRSCLDLTWRALYVALSSDNEVCVWRASHSRKERNHITLEHCLWFWHHIKDPLFCKRGEKKNIRHTLLIIHLANRQLKHSFPSAQYIIIAIFSTTLPFGEITILPRDKFYLCVLSACNQSRKEGSPAPEPEQTSGQLQWSMVT